MKSVNNKISQSIVKRNNYEQFGSLNSLMDPSATSNKQHRVQIPSATSWLYLVYKVEIGE